MLVVDRRERAAAVRVDGQKQLTLKEVEAVVVLFVGCVA
jgi:hypothetical protein